MPLGVVAASSSCAQEIIKTVKYLPLLQRVTSRALPMYLCTAGSGPACPLTKFPETALRLLVLVRTITWSLLTVYSLF